MGPKKIRYTQRKNQQTSYHKNRHERRTAARLAQEAHITRTVQAAVEGAFIEAGYAPPTPDDVPLGVDKERTGDVLVPDRYKAPQTFEDAEVQASPVTQATEEPAH